MKLEIQEKVYLHKNLQRLCFVVFASLTPQNKPHAQKWLTPLFGFAHPPPEKA